MASPVQIGNNNSNNTNNNATSPPGTPGTPTRSKSKSFSAVAAAIPIVNDAILRHFVVAFINPRSGGQDGARLLASLVEMLPGPQVQNLSEYPGLTDEQLAERGRLVREANTRERPLRIIACGGDGTINWVYGLLPRLGLAEQPGGVAVAVMPLGTGNELSRRIGWGKEFTPKMDVPGFVATADAADVTYVDEWDVQFMPSTDMGEMWTKKMSCFLSVGYDAHIAHQFHKRRESNPNAKRSRAANKMWHVIYGIGAIIKKQPKLHDLLELRVDDELIEIPTNVRCVHILNIRTTGDGLDLFRSGTPAKDSDLVKTHQPQNHGDGLIEIVGTFGPVHLVRLRMLKSAHAVRLGQGRKVTLVLSDKRDGYPIQMEGEPFIQQPGTITISSPSRRMFAMGPKEPDMAMPTDISGAADEDSDAPPSEGEDDRRERAESGSDTTAAVVRRISSAGPEKEEEEEE